MGPNLQQPQSRMFDFQQDPNGNVIGMTLRPEWASYFQSIQQIAFGSSRNGSSSARPTSDFPGRYEGMPFFDRTLGYPVYLKHASSDVWVRYDGAVA